MPEHKNEKVFEWKNVGRQYFAAIVANTIMLGQGSILGWSAPALPLLLSEDTPLIDGPLTSNQASWIASIHTLGAILGCPLYGWLTAVLGCKIAMIFLTFPSLLFWFLVYFGNTYNLLFIARFISGLTSGGIQTTVVLFVSEIANDNIRGRLGSFLYLTRNIGLLLAYVFGAIVDYQYLPCIFVFIQLIYGIVFSNLPNTPQFYIRRQNYSKAEDSLKYYKGFEGKSIDEIKAIDSELDRLKAVSEQNESDKKTNWKDFCEPEAVYGLTVGILLAFFTQFTGQLAILNYAVILFEESGSDIDPYVSSIVMASLQIFGNLCTTQLADRLNRKILIIISLVGTSFGLCTMSLYTYLVHNGYDLPGFSWVPVASMSFAIFISSAGIISLCSVCTVENLPTKIRGPGMAICSVFFNIAAFISTKSFPILMAIINLHGCLIIFAVCCTIGALFVLFFVKETKGQSMDVLK